mgnify:FL=1
MDEILENVYARLEATGLMSVLGAGIVITGGGAALKNLPAVMSERLKMEVRYSAVRKGIVASGDLVVASNPEYAVAVGSWRKELRIARYIFLLNRSLRLSRWLSLNRQWNRLRNPSRRSRRKRRKKVPACSGG